MNADAEELEGTKAELHQLRAEHQRLIEQVNEGVEEERSRLASDLHNRPLQELAGVGYQLERVSMALARGDIDAADTLVNEAADQLMRQLEALRTIMTDLRPPALEHGGLAGALAGVKARFQHGSPDVAVTIEGADTPMAVEVETVLYRVVQESLNNVARHANASAVEMKLTGDADQIEMTIQDDGIGFDVDAFLQDVSNHHNGIDAMRQRLSVIGGTLSIHSGEHGTIVRCAAPRVLNRSTMDQKDTPK